MVLLINLLQMLNESLAFCIHASQNLWRVDDVERGFRHRAGQRVTAVGRTMRADMKRRGDFLRRQYRAHREAAAQRFRAGEDIRRHAIVHIGKQIAGTPHSALYFIKHQQCLVLVAELAQPLQELRRRGQNATFSLYRLNHHRAGMVIHHRFHRMEIVKRYMDDIRRFRPKAIGILRLTAHRDGKQRATVERVMKGNDFGFERAMAHAGVMTRQLERRFVGFCSRVHKQHALSKGGIDYFSSQTQRGFVGEDVTGMPERFALRF